MNQIPESFQGSPALQLVQSQGWTWKVTDNVRILLGKCPHCSKEDHCYMEIHGNDEQRNRDGLYLCQRCGKSGNLYALKQHLGIITPNGIQSQKEWGSAEKKIDPLPDVDACHQALLEDDAALEYLTAVRGFSLDIIMKQKLGLTKHFFKETGADTRALLYPYLVNGNCVWAHFRTLPDPKDLKKVPKGFSSPTGWEAALYNGENLKEGIADVVLVEGEANTIAALDKGIINIFGIPGANIKKASWIETLDKLGLEKIYVCYDADRVGQKAAQTIASRVGVEKCWKIRLPSFEVVAEDGTKRNGKDLNEWFVFGGGTAAQFETLKAEAAQFDVDGVASATDAIDELEEELEGKGAGSKYVWPFLQNLVHFEDGDVIDILAEEKIGKTTFAMNLLEYMVDTYGDDGMLLCAEMTRARLARKWVCHKSGIADNLPKTPEDAAELTKQFKAAIPVVKQIAANRQGDLYFCYPKYDSMDEIYRLIIESIRRYGIKWIVVDNLQRLCDTTIGSRNRTQWLSEISKKLSQIAKDYNVQMVRILQPHAVPNTRLATSKDNDGSSQVAKDCDCTIVLNRNRVGEVDKEAFSSGAFIENEGIFGPELLVTVGLSRYSAGGTITLYMDGATSTVHSLTAGKIAAMTEQATKGVGYEKQAEAMGLPITQPDEGITV